jgi:hypothetical protein
MKVAIYARYSSDNQRDASIADQFRVCREFAQRQGWQIVREYSDHAVSGATLLRPGFQGLMREALRSEFDIVLAEALDLLTPLRAEVIDELRWYFVQARTHPAPSRRDDIDERLHKARDAFSAARFRALYRVWNQDGDVTLADVGSCAIHEAVTA